MWIWRINRAIPGGDSDLLVGFFASAEVACYLELGWEIPKYIIDLYAEFRVLSNGRQLVGGNGLLGALAYFGICTMASTEKDQMRDLALRGGN